MTGSFYGELFGTIGMEIEGISHTREYIHGKVIYPLQRSLPDNLGKSLNVTRDASVELYGEPVPTENGLAVFSYHTEAAQRMRNFNRGNASVMGYEIVTSPLSIPELEKIAYPLIFALRSAGDFNSHRAAIHFHVGFGNNHRLLKNALLLALNLDPVLYRLAGMGGTFRGKINRAAYARPLLNSTVCPVNGSLFGKPSGLDGSVAQVINPLKALNSKNLTEFWAAFGVEYTLGGGSNKYHPCRYQGVNFYSIPQHGTLEWRHFNKTSNVSLLMAIAKFLRGAVEMSSMLSKYELSALEVVPSNKEISVSDASLIVGKIYELCQNKEIENLPTENEIAEILSVLSMSHFEEIPEKPVHTHLREFYLLPETVSLGGLKIVRDFYPSNHVDIHNIKTISIFDEYLGGSITTKSPDEHGEVEFDDDDDDDDDENNSEESVEEVAW